MNLVEIVLIIATIIGAAIVWILPILALKFIPVLVDYIRKEKHGRK